MKLTIVTASGRKRGGAEEALIQLVHRRSELPFGLEVIVLEVGELAEEIEQSGVRCITIDAKQLRNVGRFIQSVYHIRDALVATNADAVVGWMTKAHIYGGLAAWLASVPAICFQHGLPDGGIVERISRLVPRVGTIACSEFVAREERRLSVRPVIGVPVGMDELRFKPSCLPSVIEAKRQLGFVADRPLVGIVARLQRWKGVHVFLEAFSDVLRAQPHVQGVVVGGVHELEPEYSAFLRRETDRFNLGERVRFVGTQHNVHEWMQAMDVVVHASEREPFGIVVIEAMALGKPVIAGFPGGPEEIIENNVHGLLVKSGNAAALATAIRRFLANADFARRCGEAAQIRSLQYTSSQYVRRFTDAVLSLVRKTSLNRDGELTLKAND